jgi:hypothetical protein
MLYLKILYFIVLEMTQTIRIFDTRTEMIREYCKEGDVICEIGVFLGEFAQVFLETKPSKLVLIDPWQGHVGSGDQDGNNFQMYNLDDVYTHISKKAENISCIDVRRGFSGNILQQFPDNTFDFIYIDGDHSYEGCKTDLQLSYQKIKPNGIIAGHDYEMNMTKAKNYYNFGVKQAVDEFCSMYGLTILAKGMDGCVSYAIRVPK